MSDRCCEFAVCGLSQWQTASFVIGDDWIGLLSQLLSLLIRSNASTTISSRWQSCVTECENVPYPPLWKCPKFFCSFHNTLLLLLFIFFTLIILILTTLKFKLTVIHWVCSSGCNRSRRCAGWLHPFHPPPHADHRLASITAEPLILPHLSSHTHTHAHTCKQAGKWKKNVQGFPTNKVAA